MGGGGNVNMQSYAGLLVYFSDGEAGGSESYPDDDDDDHDVADGMFCRAADNDEHSHPCRHHHHRQRNQFRIFMTPR